MSAPRLLVEPDAAAAARRAAGYFVEAAVSAVKERGVFRVALAGGATPEAAYRLLSGELAEKVPWSCCEFFFGDERAVPIGDPRSNYHMVSLSLLAPARVPRERVFRIETGLEPDLAASRYEAVLCAACGGLPILDLVLLGLGADGHTASLFPGSPALGEEARWVAPATAPVEPRGRVTLTFPTLNAARRVLFLACGAEKADAVLSAVKTAGVPASFVRPQGELVWVLDAAAAAKL